MNDADQGPREWYRDASENIVHLITINLLWFIFSVLIITAPPALAGLYYATNQLAHNRNADRRTFFEGFRKYFWQGWHWVIINFFVLSGTTYILLQIGKLETIWASWMQGALLALSLIWVIAQLFTFPLVIEQTVHRLGYAFYNSIVLMIRTPVLWFLSGIAILAFTVFSSILFLPAWIFITGSLFAYLSNHSTIAQIRRIQVRDQQ